MALNSVDKIWGEHTLKDNELFHWQVSPLALYCKSIGQEVWVAFNHSDVEAGVDSKLDIESLSWSRWAFNQNVNLLRLSPAFPDRPVVVRPDYPFNIATGGNARIYIRVPIWIKIDMIAGKNKQTVEIPTVNLSKTWFGEYGEGEYCYWISSSARREALVDASKINLVICPLDINNRAGMDFPIERICHRVSFLGIYDHNGQLWSNETRVIFHGGNETSQIKTGVGAPKDVEGAKLLTPARVSSRSGFSARTFRALQSLSDMGMRVVEEIL